MSDRRGSDSLLSEELRVSSHYLRAANVELTAVTTVSSYMPTVRGLDVVRRMTRAISTPQSNRSWSLTGPYGTGKSSFALFLSALLSACDDPLRQTAFDALTELDEGLAHELDSALSSLPNASSNGFVIATATAQPEPVAHSILRALEVGIKRRWPTRRPSEVKEALDVAHRSPSASALTSLIAAVADRSPLLLLIDEFGKNLEQFTESRDPADLFVMQAIAEHAAAGGGTVLFVTLQHLAFDDYVRGATAVERREWSKVQGRFEDIAFIETADDAARLIAGVLDDSEASPKFRKARREWAEAAMPRLEELGLAARFAGGIDTVEACYPLHPLVVLALPELCARFGQHGRTMFTFLAGTEPKSLGDYLETARWSPRHLPTVGLEDIYDFFVANAARQASSSGSRWLEVESRVREAAGRPAADHELLKIVGVLNLVSQGGVLRAAAATIALAAGNGCESSTTTLDDLQRLASQGLVAYRSFADEYRLWQGSDFDLGAAVEIERERLAAVPTSQLLDRVQGSAFVVAGRHSQRVGMLRYFATTFVDSSASSQLARDDARADGLIVYFVGDPVDAKKLRADDMRPTIVVTTGSSGAVEAMVREVAALEAVETWPELAMDWVAAREVGERSSELKRKLEHALLKAYAPDTEGVTCWLVHAGKQERLDITKAGAGVSSVLSAVCDRIYSESPVVRNEMLARRELTSQGAKARRELITAMIDSSEVERLSMEGFGPERAMYEAFLRHTGVHACRSGVWSFGPPTKSDPLRSAYDGLIKTLEWSGENELTASDLFDVLRQPPFGLTDGPLPVLLVAALLSRRDDVALFQDGTFLPALTPDVAERLVKTPDRFRIKHFALTPERRRLLTSLADAMPGGAATGPSARNESLLRVVAPLLNLARRLPDAIRFADDLSPATTAVRDVLFSAKEPDELMFQDLPLACGLRPLRGAFTKAEGARFIDTLRNTVSELEDAYPTLLRWIGTSLARALSLDADVSVLRSDLQSVSRQIGDKLLDQKLQAFVFLASDTGLDDLGWLEAIGLALAEKPPVAWRPADRQSFEAGLLAVTSAVKRVQALHFESVVDATEGFVAQRHTVTHTDGHEDNLLMAADDTAVAAARPEVVQLIDALSAKGAHELNAFVMAFWAELTERELSASTVMIRPSRAALTAKSQRTAKQERNA
jgi:hypothetical protein